MIKTKMYSERKGNITVFRGCGFSCSYCAFRASLRRSPCEKCRTFEPHAHMEVLKNIPPKTKEGEFISVGFTGDISFMPMTDFWEVIEYCRKWKDRTFLIQSKNPHYFLKYLNFASPLCIPDNVIIGTTIETNQTTDTISKAPEPALRGHAMKLLERCKKEVTIEPIMDFDLNNMVEWMQAIEPEFVYIGYDSHPERNKLPEPMWSKTQLLIDDLRAAGIEVREKLMREAWREHNTISRGYDS
jgi:DNA repair photolyase